MDGGDFKEQLDKDIAYAKSSPYEIRVECDEGLGSITSIALLSQKVTDQFNVEFKIASGVQFVGWKAYSKSSDGTYSEISEDYIKFLSYNTESNDGIYKASVKFVKGIQGIVIKPYCYLLPCVSEITPKFESAGCEQNNTIKITFNKPVNEDSFGDFTCITITDGINNLTEHFNTPSFTPDKKSLCITMKLDNPVLAPNGTKEKLDLSVRYNFSEAKDADGLSLTETGSHEYRITKELKEMPKIAVQLKSDSAVGTFESSGQKEFVEGYPVEIQFTLANTDDYRFKSFEAVSSSISAEELSGKITFGKITRDDGNGVYKTTVSIIEEVSDLVIQPVCTLLPKVAEVYPPNAPTGYDQDTTVKITFNKPVNPTTFDFSKITIKAADKTDLYSYSRNGKISSSSYYDEPYFSSDNTILYIPTVKGKTLLSKGSMDTKDVILTIDLSGTKDAEGFEIAQCEAYTYRLNGKVDNIPPELSSLELATTGDTSAYYYRTLSNKAFSDWSYDTIYESDGTTEKYKYGEFSQNHVAGTVHITVLGSDNASGLKSVKITETHIKNQDATDSNSSAVTTACGTSSDFTELSDSSGTYGYSFDYTLKSTSDGIIKLQVALVDNSDNTGTETTYYVLRDTAEREPIWKIKQWDGMIKDNSNRTTGFNMPIFNSSTGKYEAEIKFDTVEYLDKNIYHDNYDEIWQVYRDYALSTVIKSEFLISNDDVNYTKVGSKVPATLKIDPTKRTYIKYLEYHANGLVGEYKNYIPESTEIIYLGKGSNNKIGTISVSGIEELIKQTDSQPFPDYYYTVRFIYEYRESEEAPVSKRATFDSYDIDRYFNTSSYPFTPTANGIYTIYVQIINYDRSSNSIYNSPYAFYSVVGKPYIFYKGITPSSGSSEQITFPTFSLPSSQDGYSYPRCAGKATFTVDTDLNYGGRSYIIKAESEQTTIGTSIKPKFSTGFAENTISLDTGRTYTISLVTTDSCGNPVESDQKETVTLNSKENLPPYIDSRSYSWDSIYYGGEYAAKAKSATLMRYDSIMLYEYKKNSSGQIPGSRLFSPKAYLYFVNHTALEISSLDELEKQCYFKNPVEIITVNDYWNTQYFEIPLDYIDSYNADVYIYIEDSNELKNYITKRLQYYYPWVADYTPEIRWQSNSFKITVPACPERLNNNSPDSGMVPDNVISCSYFDGNKWVEEGSSDNTQNGYSFKLTKKSDNSFAENLSISDNLDKFRVIWSRYCSFDYSNNLEYMRIYVKPKYFLASYEKGTTSCQSTAWIPVSNGYQIFCDAPALVHTMYSRTKITESTGEYEASLWESRAQETAVKQNSSNFTYKTTNLDIPDGFYYTTIVHFADGTVLMGEIKQK